MVDTVDKDIEAYLRKSGHFIISKGAKTRHLHVLQGRKEKKKQNVPKFAAARTHLLKRITLELMAIQNLNSSKNELSAFLF